MGHAGMKDSPTDTGQVPDEDTLADVSQMESKDDLETHTAESTQVNDGDTPVEANLTHSEESPAELAGERAQESNTPLKKTPATPELTPIVASPVAHKKRKRKKLYIFAAVFMLICLAGSGLSLVEYQKYSTDYRQDLSLAEEGLQNLRLAEALLKTLPQNPFNSSAISQAQKDFTSASTEFNLVNASLSSLPGIITLIPNYGSRLSAALHVLPIAMEVSHAGVLGCSVLSLVISRFHDPLNTKAQGLTMADFSLVEVDFQQIKTLLNLVIDQIGHLQPSDLQLDPRLGKTLATFQKEIPTVQMWLGTVEQLLPVAPALLGIGTPANYLIELLDSTELRPGGGFMGNFGFATLSGARLTSASITDVYLLDRPFEASGKVIPYPPAYTWFDLAPASWTFRDSNLDADFPTAARYSEANYKHEGGNIQVQGVIAITPALIQQALEITGPIKIPEYNETVTAQNLIGLIHYHQLAVGGQESQRKHFTSVLAEQFLARVRQLSSTALPQFLKLFMNALHTKNLQVYLNSSVAENLLQTYHLNSAIEAPNSDSLFLVDANISPNKASDQITDTLNDQISIDANGNVIHHTTLSYAWLTKAQIYGADVYRDYLRVYVPPDSVLQSQNGWEPHGTSQAFGRQVWAGLFTLTYGQTRTITFVWKEPGAAKKVGGKWHYQYLIQKQAGTQWTLHLQVTVASSCLAITQTQGGLTWSNAKKAETLTQPLTEDLNVGLGYTCNS